MFNENKYFFFFGTLKQVKNFSYLNKKKIKNIFENNTVLENAPFCRNKIIIFFFKHFMEIITKLL